MPDDVARRVTALEEHVRQIWAHLLNVEEEFRLDVLGRQHIAVTNELRNHVFPRLDRIELELEIDEPVPNQ